MAYKDPEKAKVVARIYKENNREHLRNYNREWLLKNIDKVRAYRQDYYLKNKSRIFAVATAYYSQNKDKVCQRNRENRRNLRDHFMAIYGRECVCCHETNPRLLTMGHRLNGGRKEKLALGGWVAMMRNAVGHPDHALYETQCYNCQHISWLEHLNKQKYSLTRSVRYCQRLRARYFDVYGRSCECCGEDDFRVLSVSHKHDDGTLDRIQHGGQLGVIRHAIQHPDHDNYGTLCLNCNCGAAHNGGVCPHKTAG